MSDLIYIDSRGDKQAVDLHVGVYREAAEHNQSLQQFLAQKYPTNAEKYGSTFEQLLDQSGVYVQGNKEIGLTATNLEDVLNPKGAVITKDGVPASRLLFPAVILDVIEDKLTRDYSQNVTVLNGLLAMDESINGDRWERPVLNFSRPEQARSGPVAQLALPNSMLSITASDKSMRIPSWGIGLAISEQAQRSTTLDLVGLAVARQAQVESNERAEGHILSLLNGDPDFSQVALSSIAGKVQKAQDFDSTITANGQITYKAWLKWLVQRSHFRTITHVVTDLDTALILRDAMAKDRADNTDRKDSPSIDTGLSILNPSWPANVQIFLTTDKNWPANTIMGIDTRYGVHRVKSLTAQYSAVEQFAMKRSTMLRIDKGEMVYRFFDEAFEVLTLTV